MKYRLLLWDFDGTLADTLSIALGVYNRMAAAKNFQPITDRDAVRQMGMRDFLKSHRISTYQVPMAFNTFLREIRRMASAIRLNAGVGETIAKVATLGVQQGVVSSNATETIRQCLNANSVEDHFAYVSGTSRIFGKERRIAKAIRHCRIEPHDVLYTGDEIRDIEAARAAGIDIASVTWGLNAAETLAEHDPTYLVNHPDELLQILNV